MTVILSVSEIARKIMELIDRFNKLREDVKVEVNWQYWLANAVYVEKQRNEYFIVTRDGLVLHVIDNTEYDGGVCVTLGSVHSSSCECTCGE